MFFLNKILENITRLDKLNLDDTATPGEIKKTITEDVYLLLQKSVLSGEYSKSEAVTKIDEIDNNLGTLEVKITKYKQAKEVKERLASATSVEIPVTSNKATEVASQLSVPQPEIPTLEDVTTTKNNDATKNVSGKETGQAVNTEFPEYTKYLKKFKDKYLDKYRDLTKNVYSNLNFFSTGQEGIIADIKLLKNYKLKNELAETLGAGAALDDILSDSLFELNILLGFMDEYLECNEETLIELKSIKSYLKPDLKNNLNGEIFDLIKHKTEFLEYKVGWRNNHDPGNPAEKYNLLNRENPYYVLADKLLQHYYNMDTVFVRECEAKIEGFESKNLVDVTLEEFHHLNRYYKKKLDYEQKGYIKTLIDKFLEKIETLGGIKSGDLFDKIAYKSVYNLLYNSSMDLCLDIEKENKYKTIIDQLLPIESKKGDVIKSIFISSKIEDVKHNIDSSFLSDYYCYKILYTFIIDFVWDLQTSPEKLLVYDKSNYDDSKIKEAKEKAFKIISFLQTEAQRVLKELKISLKKMMTHEVKPAYLTFKECLIPYKWKDDYQGNLFVDSSYVPPNNFGKIKTNITSWETTLNSQFDNLRNSIEMQANNDIIDYKNSSFEKKVKDNEFKLVQIIAMFVSIATFVLINVKIFDNKSGLESFAIILGLAACFILFNLFFYFIIMAQLQLTKIHWFKVFKLGLFFLLPVALCLGSYFLLRSEGEKTSKEIKILKEKIRTDSIENRTRLDVLQHP